VSTKTQDPQNQLQPLAQYARQRGFKEVIEYVDRGASGASSSRPALDRLMRDIRSRRLDVLLVWKFDRLFRSTRHMLNTLAELRNVGVSFISLTEQLDTSSPMGEAMFAIASAMAQLERDLIRERVKAGLDRARAAGVRLGRPPKEVDRERLLEVYTRTKSIRDTAKALGLSRTFVHRFLQESARLGAAAS
jgi:DNA invertase Pin-like site-specific DNA recombinase